MKKISLLLLTAFTSVMFSQTPCSGGFAGSYPCSGLDLQAHLTVSQLGGSGIGNDSWGWTDSLDGKEYVIMGMQSGTAFVDISTPTNPIVLGVLPTHTSNSSWRDIKTYANHAFIVSEANGHGMQVFDLTRLRSVSSPPVTFTEDAHLNSFGSAHNISINEDSGYAYVIGANSYSGGPIFINIQNPTSPSVEGGFSADGYTHDAQVVIYSGPDSNYSGREILIASNEDTVTIVDVTDKSNPAQLSRTNYSGSQYTHQGWLTYDQRYYIFNDELDESYVGHNTRTRLMDFSSLDNPTNMGYYDAAHEAIDHNGYVRGNKYYMANYRAGIRILDLTNVSSSNLIEEAFFDTYPSNNTANFNGAWSVYPYFASGNLVISDIDRGLFIVKDPNFDSTPPTAICQNISVYLDATGTATIDANQIDNGSVDNTSIFSKSLDKSVFTCKDLGPNTVTLTVFDDNLNRSSCTATVTVIAEPTTFSGTWDNGEPDAGKQAIFNANYNTSIANIEACICEVDNSSTVTVSAGSYLDIYGDITVNTGSVLIVEHEGSVVQSNDVATVTNNGTINVEITTPVLKPRDFMVMGSPMTSETRGDVFINSYMVRNHITANFVPNGDVASAFPLAENFADDNGDNWVNYTGAINPAEGYLVRPQASPSDGNTTYDLVYSQGTLNNGVVNFNAEYNGTQNSSPNVLANPYASSIFADDFINSNSAIVEAIYLWEHITPPSAALPGYNNMNFSMEDISMYNLTGGVAATSGGNRPNGYISTGQGFGIKAKANGLISFDNSMRRTDNNNTLRNPVNVDRLWLEVRNSQYHIGNSTLIGFLEGATAGIDPGYDSNRLATIVSIYSQVENNPDELGIQGRESFNTAMIIPVGFSTQIDADTDLEYAISIANVEGANIESATVYLIDHQLEVTTNLSLGSYVFQSGAGTFSNRFSIYFEEFLGEIENIEDSLRLFPNPTNGIINIQSPNSTVSKATVYDVQGRLLFETIFDTAEGTRMPSDYNKININRYNTGLYFIQLEKTDGGITMKQILKK